jgi:putative membrane protein
MATLVADTAGASPFGHRLEIDFLPEAVARDLHARLGAQISRSALRW